MDIYVSEIVDENKPPKVIAQYHNVVSDSIKICKNKLSFHWIEFVLTNNDGLYPFGRVDYGFVLRDNRYEHKEIELTDKTVIDVR